jgi:hypothetical protein
MHVESQEINKWNLSIKARMNFLKQISNTKQSDFFYQKQEEKIILD